MKLTHVSMKILGLFLGTSFRPIDHSPFKNEEPLIAHHPLICHGCALEFRPFHHLILSPFPPYYSVSYSCELVKLQPCMLFQHLNSLPLATKVKSIRFQVTTFLNIHIVLNHLAM